MKNSDLRVFMPTKYDNILQNNTWELIDFPTKRKMAYISHGCEIYLFKRNLNEEIYVFQPKGFEVIS